MAALGGRCGMTVRFSMLGVTSFRCALVMCLALPIRLTVRTMRVLETVIEGKLTVIGESF
jgi:hypothetical protein